MFRNDFLISALCRGCTVDSLLGVRTVASFHMRLRQRVFYFIMARKNFYNENELIFESKPISRLFSDKTGITFGMLTVLGYAGKSESNHSKWYCRCTCGRVSKIAGSSLIAGSSKTCGVCRLPELGELHSTHGHTRWYKTSPTYKTWQCMISRCTNPNNPNYPNYGGRGITVCGRWRKFDTFLKDMGCKPIGMTIDRYPDNNGGYHPSNCRWATKKEQARNRRSNNLISFNGQCKPIEQWSEELNINRVTLWHRIFKHKWPLEKAFNTPVARKRSDSQ